MKRVPLQVYLDPRDQAQLERLAAGLGLSKAETVRVAIRRWAIEATGGEDPVLDLIGTIDAPELPADLSTRHDEYAVAGYPRRQVAERRPSRRKPR
jgi:hypothetical protein